MESVRWPTMGIAIERARTLSLLAVAALIVPSLGLSAVEKLVGEWKNPGFNHSAVLRLQIRLVGSDLVVRAFGRCGARECDWGESVADVSASATEGVTARFSVGASSVRLLISPTDRGWLLVEAWGLALPASGGSNQSRVDRLTRTGEDCLPHNPATTVVEYWRGGWAVIDWGYVSQVMWFAEGRKDQADRVLALTKHYGTTASCFVGRPGPSLHYLLVRGASPSGPMLGERCEPFTPGELVLRQRGDRWVLADGDRTIFDFEEKEAEAQRSLELIRRYGFNAKCLVEGPPRSYVYLRK